MQGPIGKSARTVALSALAAWMSAGPLAAERLDGKAGLWRLDWTVTEGGVLVSLIDAQSSVPPKFMRRLVKLEGNGDVLLWDARFAPPRLITRLAQGAKSFEFKEVDGRPVIAIPLETGGPGRRIYELFDFDGLRPLYGPFQEARRVHGAELDRRDAI